MRFFIYKILFFFTIAFFFYHFTVGKTIKNIEDKLQNSINKETADYLKKKIIHEIKMSLDKDRLLNNEDAEILRKFLKKLDKEIFLNE